MRECLRDVSSPNLNGLSHPGGVERGDETAKEQKEFALQANVHQKAKGHSFEKNFLGKDTKKDMNDENDYTKSSLIMNLSNSCWMNLTLLNARSNIKMTKNVYPVKFHDRRENE